MHPLRGKERRHIAVRQNIIRRKKAMGKTLPLLVNEIDVRDYRFSAWITNSKESPIYGPCANPGQTMKTPSRS